MCGGSLDRRMVGRRLRYREAIDGFLGSRRSVMRLPSASGESQGMLTERDEVEQLALMHGIALGGDRDIPRTVSGRTAYESVRHRCVQRGGRRSETPVETVAAVQEARDARREAAAAAGKPIPEPSASRRGSEAEG